MSTPKERFLKRFYAAMTDFEDDTGVEIHNIELERICVDGANDIVDKTKVIKYRLELK
jgi:hypothetical protein